MLDEDKILDFLKVIGPTIPSKVAKNLNKDILFTSAHLSDLVSRGKIKISRLKIGGSPLYYLEGQEEQLYNFASGNVNPKDLIVLDMIKKKQLIRESEQDLLTKVALRELRDFAIPLQVNYKGESELFWKWHLLSQEEANSMIGELLNGKKEEVKEAEVKSAPEGIIEEKDEDLKSEKELEKDELKQSNEKVSENVSDKESEVKENVDELKVAHKQKTLVQGKQVKKVKKIVKKAENSESKESDESEDHEESSEFEESDESDEFEDDIVEDKAKKKATKPPIDELIEKEAKPRKKRGTVDDTFLPQLEKFFDGLKIVIEQKETVRKNIEINFVVKVPTAVGHMIYFCKAKKKSRCDEKDLSSAYMEAQMKKKPLLFLYSNEINKKSQEMMESGAFENVTIKKV